MNITGVGIFGHTTYNSGNEVSFSLSGTFSADMEFVYSVNGGATWQTIWSGSSAVSDSRRIDTKSGGSFIAAWKCDTYRSGTVVALQSSGGDSDVAASTIFISAASLTDISSTITAAQSKLGTVGGKIVLPPGLFYTMGVTLQDNIAIQGSGRYSTFLSLPSSPTDHMFKLTDNGTDHIVNGAPTFCSLTMLGRSDKVKLITGSTLGLYTDAVAYNGVDASFAAAIYSGSFEDVAMAYFAAGIQYGPTDGSCECFYTNIKNSIFQFNTIGVAASEEIEMVQTVLNNNGSGFVGRPNDGKFTHCAFEGNQKGIAPTTADEASIYNFTASNCTFFKNALYDVQIGYDVTINACEFSGDSSKTSSAVMVIGNNNTIIGNRFNEGLAEYKDACIKVIGATAGATVSDLNIQGNSYLATDTANVGPFVKIAMTNAASGMVGLTLANNQWSAQRNQFLAVTSNTVVNEYLIDNNRINLTDGDMTAATAIQMIKLYSATTGGTISRNRFYASLGTSGCKLSAFGTVGFGKVIMTGNSFIAAGTSVCKAWKSGDFTGGTTIDDAAIVKDNIGLNTKATGIVTGTAGNNFANSSSSMSLDIAPASIPERALKSIVPSNAATSQQQWCFGQFSSGFLQLFACTAGVRTNLAANAQWDYTVQVYDDGVNN